MDRFGDIYGGREGERERNLETEMDLPGPKFPFKVVEILPHKVSKVLNLPNGFFFLFQLRSGFIVNLRFK